jgi:uncharacterized protein with HEPN domain
MWDGILERVFELSFREWSDQNVYAQAVSLWLSRIGEATK